MAYIGNTQLNQNYVPAVDFFSGNGSTTAFTLSRPVASVAAVQAVISNVPQNPGSAFTVSGSTITFTSAPPSGTNNIYVYYTSPNTQVVQPGQGTVYPASLSTGGPYWDTSGNVGIGTSSPNYTPFGGTAKVLSIGSASNGQGIVELVGTQTADGTVGVITGYNTSSSARLSQINFNRYSADNSGTITFLTNNAGSFAERMRIDTSGNVGIGTSSPYSQLDVYSAISSPTTGEATGVGSIRITNGVAALSSAGGLEFKVAGDTNGYGAKIQALNSGGAQLVFANRAASATWVERMRIDSSGNLLVGTTGNSNSAKTIIYKTGNNPTIELKQGDAGGYNVLSTAFNNSGTYYHVNFVAGSSGVGAITSTSTTTTYATSSDYRLKENIQSMRNALSVVQQLNPVTYTWKADGSDGQGFIAHELQAVVPDCVTGEKDAVDAEGKPVYQGIDTSFLVATLTKAIQELNAKVEAQAAEIAALKGQA